jgi:two-component system response regulator MprA
MSVLVVDDDPLIAGMLRLVLEGEGYEVREASDGREALVSVESDRPDVIVLDMMMPNVNGYGVLEALRDNGWSDATRVVMLTCCSQEEDVRKSLQLGADDYLTKPVDVDYLLGVVQDLLARDMADVQARRTQVADDAVLARRVDDVLTRHNRQFAAG